VDVRTFISLIKRKKYEEAYRTYTLENPFPTLCGMVCDHPCESDCLRNHYDQPIAIRELELFLASHGYSPKVSMDLKNSTKKIAIIGCGLEELSSLFFLKSLGHDVTFFVGNKGLMTLYDNLSESHGIPTKGSWRIEIENIVGTAFATIVEKDSPGDNLNQFDGVIWGLKRKPSISKPNFFWFSAHESAVARAIGKGKEAAITIDRSFNKKLRDTSSQAITLGPSEYYSLNRYLTRIREEPLIEPEPVDFEYINTRSFKKQLRIDRGRHENDPKRDPISQDDSIAEAKRCFECGICTLCGQCVAYCPDQAVRPAKAQKQVIFDYDFCKGCGICAYECPRAAICFVKEETGWR
jgi:Pyruvate/2-oxoacid:ferredoxin oxidoreductase delta subunit